VDSSLTLQPLLRFQTRGISLLQPLEFAPTNLVVLIHHRNVHGLRQTDNEFVDVLKEIYKKNIEKNCKF